MNSPEKVKEIIILLRKQRKTWYWYAGVSVAGFGLACYTVYNMVSPLGAAFYSLIVCLWAYNIYTISENILVRNLLIKKWKDLL